jgi:uncharacterized protein (TIGR04255 family)
VLGTLRDRWRAQYPHVQEMPPLAAEIEATPAGGAMLQLGFGPVPSSRYWFLNPAQSELVQLQNDRLIVNWRRTAAGDVYPRYSTIRELLGARLADLRAFLAEDRLGSVETIQVELTYINSIPEIVDGPVGDVLVGLGWPRLHTLGAPEQLRAVASFQVPDVGLDPVRLHLSVEPGSDTAGNPTAFLTLSVRGAPITTSDEDLMSFLDAAHEYIVRSFTEVTTEPMHRKWEREQ